MDRIERDVTACLRTYVNAGEDSDGNSGYCLEQLFHASCYAGFHQGAIGHLLDCDLRIAGTQYNVDRLSHHSRAGGTLTLTLSRSLPASIANGLNQHVGDRVFAFEDTTRDMGERQYAWASVNRPWHDDTYYTPVGIESE